MTNMTMLSDRIEFISGMHGKKQLWIVVVCGPEQMLEMLNESYEAPQRARSRKSQFKGVFCRIIVRVVVTQPLDIIQNISEIRVRRVGQSTSVDEPPDNKIALVLRSSLRNKQLDKRVFFTTAQIMHDLLRQLY